MTYRVKEIEVPQESPFANDDLDRKPLVDFLTGLLGRQKGPFVFAIDSPWGTGKTTLVKMLAAEMERQDFQCIQFNAWKVDYVTDPLVALVSSVGQVSLGDPSAAAEFREEIGKVKKVAAVLAKRALVAGAKVATLGVLDAEREIEAVTAELTGNLAGDLFDAFEQEQKLLGKFRDDLTRAIAQLSVAGKKENLIFFIDELDRCRPTFAIELLERIKHLFDVPNLVFVLSIDKRQLEAITAAVYGQGIDAPEYLRRFIDLEMGIPTANSKRFTKRLLSRFGLDPVFAQRTGHEIQYDKDNFIDFFTAISDAVGLTLRARERCLTRMKVVMDQTPHNHYLDPVLVALLIVLRTTRPELFGQVVTGRTSPSEVIDLLKNSGMGAASLGEKVLWVIEAHLIAADPDENRRRARVDELRGIAANGALDGAVRSAVQKHLRIIDMVSERDWDTRGRMAAIAAKIDTAAMLRD